MDDRTVNIGDNGLSLVDRPEARSLWYSWLVVPAASAQQMQQQPSPILNLLFFFMDIISSAALPSLNQLVHCHHAVLGLQCQQLSNYQQVQQQLSLIINLFCGYHFCCSPARFESTLSAKGFLLCHNIDVNINTTA